MATPVKTPDLARQKKVHFIRARSLSGNLAEFNRDRLGLLERIAREGDVTGLHFGPFSGILFNKPEHVHSILVEHACWVLGDKLGTRYVPISIENSGYC